MGRPKSNKPRKKIIRFHIVLESQEQKDQLEELGGSAWVREKLKEEKERRDDSND